MKMRTKTVDIITVDKAGMNHEFHNPQVAGTPVIDLLLKQNLLGLHFNLLINKPRLYHMTHAELDKFTTASAAAGQFVTRVNEVIFDKLDETSYIVHLTNYDQTRVKNKVIKYLLKDLRKTAGTIGFDIIQTVNSYSDSEFATAIKRSLGHYIDKNGIKPTR